MSKSKPMEMSNMDIDFHERKAEPFKMGRFIYNSAEGTVMGRDRASWGKF